MEHVAVTVEADVPEPRPERAGFDDFCRDAYAPMVRMAFLLTSSIETAEDLVQDVFARAYPRWSTISEPSAYVRRAVVNACHSHHRRRFRERAHRPSTPDAIELEADELFDVLATLPARMRSAIVLRYYQDLAENDIAEILGCAPGTARSLIHRGLARLRTVMEP
jgi:RNA polymerase sigma-70 factor (sigma-E family)